MKDKRLQIYLSDDQYGAVQAAAKRAGMTASQYGAMVVLDAVLGTGKVRDADAIRTIQNFRRGRRVATCHASLGAGSHEWKAPAAAPRI